MRYWIESSNRLFAEHKGEVHWVDFDPTSEEDRRRAVKELTERLSGKEQDVADKRV